jgi:hypothetical protein
MDHISVHVISLTVGVNPLIAMTQLSVHHVSMRVRIALIRMSL